MLVSVIQSACSPSRSTFGRILLLGCVLSFTGGTDRFAQGIRLSGPLADLPGTGGQVFDFEVSADSQHIVYRADQDGDGSKELFSAGLGGGEDSVLLTPFLVAGGDVQDYEIAQDGGTVVYLADQLVDNVIELFAVPRDGSQAPLRLNDRLVTGGNVTQFRIAPDGSRAIYRADQETNNSFHLYSVPLDGSSGAVRLTGAPMVFSSFEVTPDSAFVIYHSSEDGDGMLEFRRVPSDGSQASIRLADAPIVEQWEITDDSQWIVHSYNDLWRVPIAGGPALVLNDAVAGGGRVFSFQLHSDSTRVLYGAGPSPGFGVELFVVDIDGSTAPMRLHAPFTSPNQTVSGYQVTPAGDKVLFSARMSLVAAPLEVFVAPLDASAAPVSVSPPPSPNSVLTDYAISPDSNWVAYSYREDLVGNDLFSVPLDGSAAPTFLFRSLPSPFFSLRVGFDAESAKLVFQHTADLQLPFELYSIPVEGGRMATKLHPDLSPLRSIADWDLTPDAATVALRSDMFNTGTTDLFEIDLAGAPELERINENLAPGEQVGVVTDFRSTENGRTFVYRANAMEHDRYELFSVQLESRGKATRLNGPLASTDVHEEFEISPDGTRVVYLAEQDTEGVLELYSAPIDGSAPAVKLNGPLVLGGNVRGVSVFPRRDRRFLFAGERVIYSADQDIDETFELYSVPLQGGQPAVKLNAPLPPGGDVRADFRVSPDGALVVYRADQDVDEQLELYRVPADGSGSPLKISGPLPTTGDVRHPFNSSGVGFALSHPPEPGVPRAVYIADAETDNIWELYSVPIDGSQVAVKLSGALVPGGSVDNPLGNAFEISPTGSQVVYLADQDILGTFELYTVPIDGSSPPLKVNRPLAANRDVNTGFQFSPDGSRIVFVADQGVFDRFELYSAPADGSGTTTRLNDFLGAGDVGQAHLGQAFYISPDSARVVYYADPAINNVYEAFSAPLDGSVDPIRLGVGTIDIDLFHSTFFSPAGDQVFFKLDGHPENVMQADVDGAASAKRLNTALESGESVTAFTLTRDGTRIAYTSNHDGRGVELFLRFLDKPPHLRASAPKTPPVVLETEAR